MSTSEHPRRRVLLQLSPIIVLAFAPLVISVVVPPMVVVHVLINLAGMAASACQDMDRAGFEEKLAFWIFLLAFLAPGVVILLGFFGLPTGVVA